MIKAKQRTEQHLIDEDGQKLLRSVLPRSWVLREYRPDYGLDFALEIFQEDGGTETLGEHIFIQLKSVKSIEALPLKLYARGNVEKQRETINRSDLVGTMDTIRFQLETSELITIERMGIGVPVLLVIADITAKRCSFVCLNDYIDKILIPRHDNYRAKATRTIHVPIWNDISDKMVGISALRWYGKRAKLMAAFQRIIFQKVELDYAWSDPPPLEMARYFASRLIEYDFWNTTEMCGLIAHYGSAVRRFLDSGYPDLMIMDPNKAMAIAHGDADVAAEIVEHFRLNQVRMLWELLSVLPRNYEDVWREWFLPTPLSLLSSYP